MAMRRLATRMWIPGASALRQQASPGMPPLARSQFVDTIRNQARPASLLLLLGLPHYPWACGVDSVSSGFVPWSRQVLFALSVAALVLTDDADGNVEQMLRRSNCWFHGEAASGSAFFCNHPLAVAADHGHNSMGCYPGRWKSTAMPPFGFLLWLNLVFVRWCYHISDPGFMGAVPLLFRRLPRRRDPARGSSLGMHGGKYRLHSCFLVCWGSSVLQVWNSCFLCILCIALGSMYILQC